MRRYSALPWVLPFLIFVGLLVLQQFIAVPVWVRFVLPMAAIVLYSRPALGPPPRYLLFSIGVGIAVFIVWIAPDLIAPGWRHMIPFDNPIMGHPAANTPPASRNDLWFLVIRIGISVIAVPILEELFWRGWLMRWIIDPHEFRHIKLGSYTPLAFWGVAILFASEHGSFWDVGLLAGVIYNGWMIRTRNIWDCIVAHAVTNGILAAYVVVAGQWQYWL